MAHLRIVLVLSLILLLPACGLFPKEEDKTKDWSASKFYSEASAQLADGNYEEAIKYYEMLEARYPFGRYAMQAQLDIAYTYYKYDEPESAIAAADRFIKLNPRNPHVDYAYYLKGLVNFNRNIGLFDRFVPFDPSQRDPGAARQSFEDFGELVRRFPESEYAEDARQRMVFLRNTLAQYEVNAGDFYLRRGAYVAAANRAKYVLEHHPRTPAVRNALQLLAKSYDQMGLDDLAADTRRVLAHNEKQGTFAEFDVEREEKTFGQMVWDYLELDKN